MKKILALLVIMFSLNAPSFAFITPQESVSESYIQGHGHSDEMSRLIDLQNAQINDVETKYTAPQEHWQTLKYPKWLSEKKISFIRRFFIYIDPGLNDEKFMQQDINYTNRWDDL